MKTFFNQQNRAANSILWKQYHIKYDVKLIIPISIIEKGHICGKKETRKRKKNDHETLIFSGYILKNNRSFKKKS